MYINYHNNGRHRSTYITSKARNSIPIYIIIVSNGAFHRNRALTVRQASITTRPAPVAPPDDTFRQLCTRGKQHSHTHQTHSVYIYIIISYCTATARLLYIYRYRYTHSAIPNECERMRDRGREKNGERRRKRRKGAIPNIHAMEAGDFSSEAWIRAWRTITVIPSAIRNYTILISFFCIYNRYYSL